MPTLLLVSILALGLAACGPLGGGATPEPTPGILPVGQKAEYDDIGLTVLAHERKTFIGEATTPGQGNVFVVVEVSISNGRSHKLPHSRYQFKVVDDQGRTFEPLAVPGQERPLLASELDPQKDVSGTVVFRVPANVGPLVLHYGVPGTRSPIRIDLGA